MTKRKLKVAVIESTVTSISNSGHVYLPKEWVGKAVKVTLLSSLVVLILVTLITSQTAAIAKKDHQPTQAVGNPTAGPPQPTSSSPAAPTTTHMTDQRIDVFVHGNRHHSSNHHSVAPKTTNAAYITGTLVDCNVVFATPNYFSTLAINSCNSQYGAR